jgi:hypothetical protein
MRQYGGSGISSQGRGNILLDVSRVVWYRIVLASGLICGVLQPLKKSAKKLGFIRCILPRFFEHISYTHTHITTTSSAQR